MSDLALDALQFSLHGLAARQRAIADNIANMDTPGYSAKRVDFESSLRDAIRSGSTSSASLDEHKSTDAAGINGNNVNIDQETLELSDTNLRYQLAVEATNAKFRLLRASIRGQL